MTSAMHIVADRETPTLQWTRVAAPSYLPLPRNKKEVPLVSFIGRPKINEVLKTHE